MKKAELDLRFLYDCKDNNVYPNFVKWRNVKHLRPKSREQWYKRNLNDLITEKRNSITDLKSTSANKDDTLRNTTTWMKYHVIKYSITHPSA